MAIDTAIALVTATLVGVTNAATPSSIAVAPLIQKVVVPDYDFVTQQRITTTDIKIAGRYTAQSQQTYDHNGKPRDASSDNND